mgnify:CR=1 FL=1
MACAIRCFHQQIDGEQLRDPYGFPGVRICARQAADAPFGGGERKAQRGGGRRYVAGVRLNLIGEATPVYPSPMDTTISRCAV